MSVIEQRHWQRASGRFEPHVSSHEPQASEQSLRQSDSQLPTQVPSAAPRVHASSQRSSSELQSPQFDWACTRDAGQYCVKIKHSDSCKPIIASLLATFRICFFSFWVHRLKDLVLLAQIYLPEPNSLYRALGIAHEHGGGPRHFQL